MDQYGGLSEIYDKMIGIDYDNWSNFLKEYFNRNNVGLRGKKALELACGTGNMTLNLKKLGLDVCASDISEDMLCVAQNKAMESGQRIIFLKQDMRDFKIDRKFDFVFSFCDGFNYILNIDELRISFSNIYNHLKPGGYFVFDVSTLFKFKNKIGNEVYTMVKDDVSYIWENTIDGDKIIMDITFFIRKKKLYERVDEKHVQRGYSEKDLEMLLREAGFSSMELLDGYSFENIKATSDRLLVICKKEE